MSRSPEQHARRLHGSFRAIVHAALRDAGMTRSDLARELGIPVTKLIRALDRPGHLTFAGMGRICAALELDLRFEERHADTRRQRVKLKRLGKG